MRAVLDGVAGVHVVARRDAPAHAAHVSVGVACRRRHHVGTQPEIGQRPQLVAEHRRAADVCVGDRQVGDQPAEARVPHPHRDGPALGGHAQGVVGDHRLPRVALFVTRELAVHVLELADEIGVRHVHERAPCGVAHGAAVVQRDREKGAQPLVLQARADVVDPHVPVAQRVAIFVGAVLGDVDLEHRQVCDVGDPLGVADPDDGELALLRRHHEGHHAPVEQERHSEVRGMVDRHACVAVARSVGNHPAVHAFLGAAGLSHAAPQKGQKRPPRADHSGLPSARRITRPHAGETVSH